MRGSFARAARASLALASLSALSCAGSDGSGPTPAAAPPAAPPPIAGTLRLLDRLDAWTIESTWDPRPAPRPEEGIAPSVAFDFEHGFPTGPRGLIDAQQQAPLPGTRNLRDGTTLAPEPAPRVAPEAAASGGGGLRFEHASGVVYAILPLHPDTPYVFSARVRRGVDPAALASGGEAAERARHGGELARDALAGGIVLLELHQQPAAGISLAALLQSFAQRENVLVAPHVLAATRTGEWEEARLEFRSSIFTSALVVGLVGGNPGWWRLDTSTRAESSPPEGSVDFDDVRLVELPLARWLATATAVATDDLPCDAPHAGAAGATTPTERQRAFVRKVHVLGDARRALLAPPGTTAIAPLVLPRGRFRLSFGYGVLEERRPGFGTAPIEFTATLEREGRPPRELVRRRLAAAASAEASAWQDFSLEDEGDGGGARLVLATSGEAARGEVAAFAEPKLEPLRAPSELPRNVLLVSIDTLRADRLGCQGYQRADGEATTPRLDELARESLRFANARTVAPFTLPAHATMFTGLAPRVHRVVHEGRRLTSGVHPLLVEEFAAAGYATGAFTGGAFMSYEHGFHHGFDRYSILDPFLTAEDPYREAFPRPGDRAWNDAAYAHHDRSAVERWIDAQSGRPFFLFVHTYVAHNYHPPVALERRFVKGDPAGVLGPARDLKWLDLNVAAAGARIAPEVARVASDVYDAAVAAADAQVGALIGFLRERGLLDRTIVAVVSDHGEEFGEHGGLLHGRTVYEEVLRVPFLLRVPGVGPAVVEEPVDLTDLAPTLRDAAALPREPRCDGRSVLERVRDGRFEESFWAEVSAPGLARRQALRSRNWKLLATPGAASGRDFEEPEYASRRPPELELFDLDVDPGERENFVRLLATTAGAPALRPDAEQLPALIGWRRALAQRRAELDARRGELFPDVGALEYEASAGSRRLLQAIGYTGASSDGADDD